MDPINWWLVVPLVLSQLAGIGGFVLSVYNYRQAKYRPKLEDQRKYRSQLRDILFPINPELTNLKFVVEHDKEIPKEFPALISDAEQKIAQIGQLLDGTNFQVQVLLLRNDLMNIRYNYSAYKLATAKVASAPTEADRRRYQSTHANLTESLNKAMASADKCVKKTIELDDVPPVQWKFWRRWKIAPAK